MASYRRRSARDSTPTSSSTTARARREVCKCCDEGISLFTSETETPAKEAFMEIAEAFMAHVTALKRLSQECVSTFELNWKEMT